MLRYWKKPKREAYSTLISLKSHLCNWEKCLQFPYIIANRSWLLILDSTIHPVCVSAPDIPRNFTFSISNNSIVYLEWLHPWKTGRRLDHFNITVEEVTSRLSVRVRRFIDNDSYVINVTNYRPRYETQLDLLPSTEYNISIKSVTIEDMESNTSTLNFWTFSTVNFSGKLNSSVHEAESTIQVNIPDIMNSTRSSMLYVIVKGQHGDCKDYVLPNRSLWEKADVSKNDVFWQVAAISVCVYSCRIYLVLCNCAVETTDCDVHLFSKRSEHFSPHCILEAADNPMKKLVFN